jgi:hypothetical protein
MQPIGAFAIADFGMLAGYVPGWIRQGPIEVGVSSDVNATLAVDGDADRATVRQRGFVFNPQMERHH